jgi:hypothetical protein
MRKRKFETAPSVTARLSLTQIISSKPCVCAFANKSNRCWYGNVFIDIDSASAGSAITVSFAGWVISE